MTDYGDDVILLLTKLRILAFVFMDNGVDNLPKESIVDIQKFAMAGSTAHQAAQDIASAFVGGQDTVTDHKDGGTNMVRNHTERNIGFMVPPVIGAGELADLVGNIHHRIYIKERIHILADTGKAFKPHAGIDILLLELGIIVVPIVIELGENIIPDFNITVAVTAYRACRLTAAKLLAAVIIDFRAGAAGACAVFPEVIFLAKTEDTIRSDADLFVPDIKRFIVFKIDRGVKTIRLKPYPFRRGEEFPAPGNRFMLEVITEREIAEHFEIGTVTGCFAYVIDIAGTDALLAGADSVPRWLLFTSEIGLHGRHTGIDKKDAGVILRDKRKAGEAEMAFGLKKAQEHLTQFIQAVIRMHSNTSGN